MYPKITIVNWWIRIDLCSHTIQVRSGWKWQIRHFYCCSKSVRLHTFSMHPNMLLAEACGSADGSTVYDAELDQKIGFLNLSVADETWK